MRLQKCKNKEGDQQANKDRLGTGSTDLEAVQGEGVAIRLEHDVVRDREIQRQRIAVGGSLEGVGGNSARADASRATRACRASEPGPGEGDGAAGGVVIEVTRYSDGARSLCLSETVGACVGCDEVESYHDCDFFPVVELLRVVRDVSLFGGIGTSEGDATGVAVCVRGRIPRNCRIPSNCYASNCTAARSNQVRSPEIGGDSRTVKRAVETNVVTAGLSDRMTEGAS